MKAILTAAVFALTATAVTAGPLEDAHDYGKCIGIAHRLMDDFSIDVKLSDDWSMDKLQDIRAGSAKAYSALYKEVSGSLGPENEAAVKQRLNNRFAAGVQFGWEYVNEDSGLGEMADYVLRQCSSN